MFKPICLIRKHDLNITNTIKGNIEICTTIKFHLYFVRLLSYYLVYSKTHSSPDYIILHCNNPLKILDATLL